MDLNALKKQFRHKQKAELSDIDTALKAVPFLIREIERLENQLAQYKSRLTLLSSQINKRFPLTKQGKKGEGEWEIRIDEEKNRLYIKLSGFFDYQAAKIASNTIVSMMSALLENADAVNDLSELKGFDKRAIFQNC